MLASRQIHLDFHTSEHIPGIASAFDAGRFAQTFADAHVNSVTVFSRCHHGWLYYDSKAFPELVHPHLQRRDLLIEQVRALHAAGIRAPIYITVQWDYHSAVTHPDWLARNRDGSHLGNPFSQPGFYQSLCVNTPYLDFLKAQTREICGLLGSELDGVFFDITKITPCWCDSCRAEMASLGIDTADEDAVRRFACMVINRFKAEMTALVHAYNPDCTVFYNAGHIGPCTRDSVDAYTHFEIESLPSGSWGYLHFPVAARYARKLGKDVMGMTGKFHTEWGDFHSLKNRAALEYECFRMLSYGFACSIGDQLEPYGVLNPATYALIGDVYGMIAAREAWARPSVPVVEAAVVTTENPLYEQRIPASIMGAVQMLEELALQFDLIDPEMELAPYALVILPEDLIVSEAFQLRLDAYVAQGGKVLAFGKGGLSAQGRYPASFQSVYLGTMEKTPDFIIAEGALASGLYTQNEYVMYLPGERVAPRGAQVALEAHAPYFARHNDHFCSHRYTPSAHSETLPAALDTGDVLLYAHPMFSQYRENASLWCKQLVGNAIDRLLPARLVRHDGPSSLAVSLLHQPQHSRYVLFLLSYIPIRKSATIDIIEERTRVHNVTVTLSLPRMPRTAVSVPDGTALPYDGGTLTIPEIDGLAMIELPYAGEGVK